MTDEFPKCEVLNCLPRNKSGKHLKKLVWLYKALSDEQGFKCDMYRKQKGQITKEEYK